MGVIGICHCPHAPDVAAAYAEFTKLCRRFNSALALRCFAFEPADSHAIQDSKQKEHLIMFPPGV